MEKEYEGIIGVHKILEVSCLSQISTLQSSIFEKV